MLCHIWFFCVNCYKLTLLRLLLSEMPFYTYFGYQGMLKLCIMLHGKPISELRCITCRMGSHSVICHPTQANTPHLNPARQASTRFTCPGGMEG